MKHSPNMAQRSRYLAVGMALLALCACSTTKHIPDDDQLFIGLTKIDYQKYEENSHAEATQEEVEAALATAPNGALFGSSFYRSPFPYSLWIWNAFGNSKNKLSQWIAKTFGKPPVLMSQVNPALRASVAKSVLRKNGYLHGNVSYSEVPQKNPKKMKIGYTVTLDSLFTVDSMAYVGFTTDMKHLIDSTKSEARIAKGSPFSVSLLDGERTRLAQLFRNNGHYFYSPGYASYLADTFDTPYRAKLRLQLADSLSSQLLQKWYIGKINMELRRNSREVLTDTISRRFLNLRFSGKKSPLRPRVILRNLKLRPRTAYSYENYVESMQKINATGMFSQTDFQFTPRAGTDTLDLTLNCVFDKPYDFYFEANFINRTIGRMGPEARIGFTRRNALRGGEKIDINLHGTYEWQTGSGGSDMSSYQYGVDASIEFPRIIAPFVTETVRPRTDSDGKPRRPRRFFSTPWTIAKVSTDVVRRPNYYKMHIVSGEWTYRWQQSASSRHELSPLTLKYQYMNNATDEFRELVAKNPYLTASMSDYFVPKMRYTYTYTSPSTQRNPIRWETTLEESGNLTALWDLSAGRGWNQKDKTLFKNPYSQFLKIETDLTKSWRMSSRGQLVGHLNAGYVYYYGNSDELPFSERFWVGGANSVRAFSARRLGPGAFPGMGSGQASYLIQNGNVKFVANLEYRHRLFGSLYGAVFLDAGNVWNTEDWTMDIDTDKTLDEDQLQAALIWNESVKDMDFTPHTFFKQLATGTGIGLRYDLDFLVLRVDWGFALHAPYDTGNSGYFNLRRFKRMHTLHVAIGYPF